MQMTAGNFNHEQSPPEAWSSPTTHQAKMILMQACRRRLLTQMDTEDSAMFPCAELIDSGHLDGWVTLGPDGRPSKITDVRITALGREYLDNLDDEMTYSPPLFREQILWLAKGFAVIVLLGGLWSLVPETDILADKSNNINTNTVSNPEARISPAPIEAALASLHPEQTLEAHAITGAPAESFPIRVQSSTIE